MTTETQSNADNVVQNIVETALQQTARSHSVSF